MKDIGSKFEKRYLSSFAEIISDLTAKGNAAFSAALNANRIFVLFVEGFHCSWKPRSASVIFPISPRERSFTL